MKFLPILILVAIFGLPHAAYVSRINYIEREVGIPEGWSVVFSEGIRGCGGTHFYWTRGCAHYKEKVIEMNTLWFMNGDRALHLDLFDRVFIHEIGHARGLRHGEKLQKFIKRTLDEL